MLRDLLAGDVPVDPLNVYWSQDRAASGRPWVMLNMVTSIDGATAVEGGSTELSDEDDRLLFRGIRAIPDVILVGAGTVRAEDYRPVTLDDERKAMRIGAGLSETPTLAIVTGRLSLDLTARVFADPDHRPTIITGIDADEARVEAFSKVADIKQIDRLDGVDIINALQGAKVVLCEGGPSLNGQLVTAGLVDEITLTFAPVLVSGGSSRLAHGEAANPPAGMGLDRLLRGERSLFLRYVREQSSE